MAGRSLRPFAPHGCSAIYLLLEEPQPGAGTQAKCFCYQGREIMASFLNHYCYSSASKNTLSA